jgi:type II secretory ATPase GspE/PulE/Tfp pilus assembly ATPase PilB-like protein
MRLMDMGIESYKVAAALVGVIAQRLVRTICPHCRAPYHPPAELLETLHYWGDKSRPFVRGEGCRECYDTGFRGRIGIYEVMIVNAELREMIARQATLEEIRGYHRKQGGDSLLQQGLRVAEQELTSLDEVSRVAFFE